MYRCKFYKGDYRERQEQANADRCAAYVEHHFNSSTSPTASYAVVITGANASQTSRNWGRWYAQAAAREFSLSVGGVAPRGVPRRAAGRPDAKTGPRTKRSKPLRARRPPGGN